MGDSLKEAWEKVRKRIEGLSTEEKEALRRGLLRAAQEQTNLEERLQAARAFAAAMDKEAHLPRFDKK